MLSPDLSSFGLGISPEHGVRWHPNRGHRGAREAARERLRSDAPRIPPPVCAKI